MRTSFLVHIIQINGDLWSRIILFSCTETGIDRSRSTKVWIWLKNKGGSGINLLAAEGGKVASVLSLGVDNLEESFVI